MGAAISLNHIIVYAAKSIVDYFGSNTGVSWSSRRGRLLIVGDCPAASSKFRLATMVSEGQSFSLIIAKMLGQANFMETVTSLTQDGYD